MAAKKCARIRLNHRKMIWFLLRTTTLKYPSLNNLTRLFFFAVKPRHSILERPLFFLPLGPSLTLRRRGLNKGFFASRNSHDDRISAQLLAAQGAPGLRQTGGVGKFDACVFGECVWVEPRGQGGLDLPFLRLSPRRLSFFAVGSEIKSLRSSVLGWKC